MSKKAKESSRQRRRDEKKKRKLANYVKFGPKVKSGSVKGKQKLKGERKAAPPMTNSKGHAKWSYKQKIAALQAKQEKR